MTGHANETFWEAFRALTPQIRTLARRQYRFWRRNPLNPPLHFKKVADDSWFVRIGKHHRELATQVEDTLIWFWIGNHADYERILK